MPRPKGSKNKKKPAGNELTELLRQKREERAALAREQETLTRQAAQAAENLKAAKARLRKLDRELETLERKLSEARAAEQSAQARRTVQAKIDGLLAQGKTLDDILGLLGQE